MLEYRRVYSQIYQGKDINFKSRIIFPAKLSTKGKKKILFHIHKYSQVSFHIYNIFRRLFKDICKKNYNKKKNRKRMRYKQQVSLKVGSRWDRKYKDW